MIDAPLQTMIDEVLPPLTKWSCFGGFRTRAHVKANQCLLLPLRCST